MARRASAKSASKSKPRAAARKEAAPRRARGRSKERESRSIGGARPIWSGNLRLALVSVPVKIYPATASGARISFHQVHKPSGKRIRYQKIVPGVGPVEADDIVSGYELENGRYVLLEPEEIDELKLEAKRTLDLVQFVAADEVDPIWFERPYYVVPDGELAEEAYGVMRDAMTQSGKYGIGQVVMRGREYIACIKPCGNGLMLETLRFADEVREAAPYFSDIEGVKPDKEMLELARELIERKSAPFEPEKFHDQYTEAVRELIEAKRKNEKPVAVDEEELPSRGAEVIDLVDALKRSVKGSGREAAEPRRKKA